MQCREVRIVIYCVTSTKLLTTRGVTLRHPLFSVRLEFTVMHVKVAAVSGTSMGRRSKILVSVPVVEALIVT